MSDTGTQDSEDAGDLEVEFLTWKLFEVGLPVVILTIGYATAIFAFAIPHPFVTTFASGDLLPITTVVLLGCTVEMDKFMLSARTNEQRKRAQKQKNWNIAVVVIVAMIFGVLKGAGLATLDLLDGDAKAAATIFEFPWGAYPVNSHLVKLAGFALFSIVVGAIQLTMAYYSKTQLVRLFAKAPGKKS